jgi:hypothetical protein
MEELERRCWRCDGTGYIQNPGHFEPEECGYCTQGYIATYAGEALIEFLRRHGAMFSDQITGDDAEETRNVVLMMESERY